MPTHTIILYTKIISSLENIAITSPEKPEESTTARESDGRTPPTLSWLIFLPPSPPILCYPPVQGSIPAEGTRSHPAVLCPVPTGTGAPAALPGEMLSPHMARAADADGAPRAFAGFCLSCCPGCCPSAAILGVLPGLLLVQLWGLCWLIVSDLGISAMEAQRAFTVQLLRNQPLIFTWQLPGTCVYIYVCV